jgi:hypothetical protein
MCKCLCPQCFIWFFRRMLQVRYLDVVYVSHICCKCFIWMLCMFAMVFNGFCKCFRRMVQVFDLSFLYITTITSGCFKSRSGIVHGMRVGNGRGRERSPRSRAAQATFWQHGPRVGTGDTSTVEQHPDSAGPSMDAWNGGKKTGCSRGHSDGSSAVYILDLVVFLATGVTCLLLATKSLTPP